MNVNVNKEIISSLSYISSETLDQTNIYNCHKTINDLFDKYSDNHYMLNKINNYIANLLPIHLDNDLKNYNKKQERYDKLIENSREFIDKYLNSNNYFYCSSSEIYFKYDSINYSTCKVDDIIHEVCSLINRNENITAWKHKIKLNIQKEIRERNIFDSIPDTDTIQFVINNLMPLFLNNKDQVKYFLTIIGDIILKKNEQYEYLIDIGCKKLIKLLSSLAYEYFGANHFNNFKYKYHEQHTNCRIVFVDKNIVNNKYNPITDLLINNFNNNLLNLFIVGIHYSKRYENSENYLKKVCDNELYNNINLLENNDRFVCKFIESMIERTTHNDETIDLNTTLTTNHVYNHISGKNMHYLWKLFLKENNLPNIYLLSIFKTTLKNTITHNEKLDIYIGISSKKIPIISLFMEFWNKTMICEEINIIESHDDNILATDIDIFHEPLTAEYSLEISEIILLFKFWLNKNNHDNISNINEPIIIEIIGHFFENVVIEEETFINNIKNLLWDKNEDIIRFLAEYKTQTLKLNKKRIIKIDNLYSIYCTQQKTHENNFIVHKNYFKKFVYEYLQEYIVDTAISVEWIEKTM